MRTQVMGLAVFTAGLAGLAITSVAPAAIVSITGPNTTLASVIGNQFLVGDKLFTVPANGFQSVAFNASQIFISPVINADPLTGQGFRLTGAFNDAPGNGGSDFVLSYNISITPEFIAQGYRFNDADLRFNGAATGAGSFARVDETILNSNNQVLVNKSVFAIAGGVPPDHLDDHSFLPGYTTLNIVKDVQFFSAGTGGTSSASFVDQSFSQMVIPLPTTAALGFGALASGLAAGRRRR